MRFWPVRSLLSSVLLLLFLSLSFSNELNGQTTISDGLTGVVTNPSNALVPNAEVEIKDNAKSTAQSTKTDREGVYRFFFLARGRYTLTVGHEGFQKELLGPPGTVNVTFEIAKANRTGGALLLETDTSFSGIGRGFIVETDIVAPITGAIELQDPAAIGGAERRCALTLLGSSKLNP